MNREINDIFEEIQTFRIQGATNIARTIIGALIKYSDEIAEQSLNKEDFIRNIKNIAKKLAIAQSVESMAQNIIGFIIFELQDPAIKNVGDCKKIMERITNDLIVTIEENEEKFIENGTKLIESMEKKTRSLNIFTHCYSSGVRSVLEKSDNKNIDLKVFNIETRPVLQGRITAKRLADVGISVTMCLDSAATFIISKKSGRDLDIDLVLLGADSISLDGSVMNKTGGYGMSLSAFHEKIPVYIVTSLLKTKKGVNNFTEIPIEKRSFKEIWPEAPIGVNIMNLAYDIIPSEFITGFVSEFGILKPEELKDVIKKNYPRLI
ncbi:MAG: hypothetical protein P1P85_00750 [Patescibacteria group bacterium]|nr:hypothetical protein [Patescibacteria group bacterium]